MTKKTDKMMDDLHRLIEAQDFKSEADLKKFLDNLIGKEIPSVPDKSLSPARRAQNLVYRADDLSPAKGKRLVAEALHLDPDCIDAYEYLGMLEETAEIAMIHFEKAVAIGRRCFGGKYLEENKGAFWGLTETRPFMRCLFHYSDCLATIGKVKECVAILEEMIELNPNDNQGVRDQLMLYLIQLNEDKKFKKYVLQYKDEVGAFADFNRALFAFKTEGASKNANKKLLDAHEENKFVIPILLSKKVLGELPSRYSLGGEDEAIYYCTFARDVWRGTKGAILWAKGQSRKKL